MADGSRDRNSQAWQSLASQWQAQVEPELAPGEELLGWFETDLSPGLEYTTGLVIFTNRQLLGISPGFNSASIQNGGQANGRHRWHSWSLDGPSRSPDLAADGLPPLELRHKEFGPLGMLELLGPTGQLAHWRYTVGKAAAAGRFVRRFQALLAERQRSKDGLAHAAEGAAVDPLEAPSLCPTCGGVLAPDQTECAACVVQAVPPPAQSLSRLLQFAKPRFWPIMLGFGLTLASTAAALVPPYLTMPLMDKVLVPHQNGIPVDFGIVRWYLLGLAGAAVVAWLLSWARTYVLAWVSEQISADLRNQTYAHLQKLSLDFFGNKRTGDLVSRVGSDTDRICTFMSVNLVEFATDILMILMTSIILLSIDPVLALVVLVPFPAIAWLIQGVRGKLRHGFGRGYQAWGEMISVLTDTIPGIRVVKAFAQETREVNRFQRSNEHVRQANNKVNRVWAFFGPMITLLTEAGLLVVWACGAWRVAHAEITIGVLTAFLAYISRFYIRLESMSRMIAATQRAAAASHRIFEILDRVPTVAEPEAPVHLAHVEGRVELRDVRFQYGTRPVIQGVSLSIEPGEMIGLVGPSGAGKSTLINLICRFYDVCGGAILVDGVDVRSLPIEEYRRNIGIVLQEPFLFYGTVAENIAYGRPNASRAEIIAAARAARAHEFIMRLPDGYDSFVGERGQMLSGGERQRVSIARALLIDPRILILDEATSSVDTETEREIQEALNNLIQGRTTIAIAHRLSTLRRANRLVVLEHGEITEVGHHDELLEKSGTYSRLHQVQLEMIEQVAV